MKTQQETPDGAWRAAYRKACAGGYQVTALRRSDGYCYDFCGEWEASRLGLKPELLGTRWLEFVLPADVARIIAWLQSDDPGPFLFTGLRANMPGSQLLRVSLTKVCHGDVAVCIGGTRPISPAQESPHP